MFDEENKGSTKPLQACVDPNKNKEERKPNPGVKSLSIFFPFIKELSVEIMLLLIKQSKIMG